MSGVAGYEAVGERIAALLDLRSGANREFFAAHAEGIARCCHRMAERFARGGRLVALGETPAARSDARHVAVEFVHPVIVGKRALPAIGLASEGGSLCAQVELIAEPADIAIAFGSEAGQRGETARALARARQRGCLTIAFTDAGAEWEFPPLTEDPFVAQELVETLYHVLWELVHVFFEHPGLLDDACITCGDVAVQATVVALTNGTATIEKDGAREDVAIDLVEGVEVGDVLLCHAGVALEKVPEGQAAADAGSGANGGDDPTSFLYPFLEREETDIDSVLADVEASTRRKAEDVIELRSRIDTEAVARCAAAVRERLERGGHLISFGNGGSSTDAQDLATDALARGWPAVSLTNDVATVTAVGNDVGFDKAFSRQLIPLGRAGDVAVAISTSGSSDNLIAGLEEARRRHMLTIGIAGYDGGRMAELGWLDHLFVVPSDYIPRIQEAQATIYHLLLEAVGERG